MRASQIHVGDRVEVDRGGVFEARVTGDAEAGRFPIRPTSPAIGYFAASARQIRRVLRPSAEQLQIGGGA